jgi:hypothetical protein
MEFTYLQLAKPSRFDRNNFLTLPFAAEDSIQRLFLYEKLEYLSDARPTILQVGDSSGLHGVQPPIVEAYVPGQRYLNFGVATNVGYAGYYEIAKYLLKRDKSIKYLVLYTTFAGGQPRASLWWDANDLLAGDIHREFNDPFHRALQLPSLAARPRVTDAVYYLDGAFKRRDAPRSQNRGYLMFNSIFRDSGGWARETDNPGDIVGNIWSNLDSLVAGRQSDRMPAEIQAVFRRAFPVTDESYFDWSRLEHRSRIEDILSEFAELARTNGVMLIVIPNPMPESIRTRYSKEVFDVDAMTAALQRFKQRHGDVVVEGAFDYWPDDRFSVFSHVATPFARANSERVGRLLARVVNEDPNASTRGSRITYPQTRRIPFGSWFAGYGWTEPVQSKHGAFRRIVGRRREAIVFSTIAPGHPYRVRLWIHPSTSQNLIKTVSLAVFGEKVERIESGSADGLRYVDWRLPRSISLRYSGWLELLISTRGKTTWDTRLLAKSDQSLSVVRMDLATIH